MPSKSELESPAKTSTTGTGAQVQENGNEDVSRAEKQLHPPTAKEDKDSTKNAVAVVEINGQPPPVKLSERVFRRAKELEEKKKEKKKKEADEQKEADLHNLHVLSFDPELELKKWEIYEKKKQMMIERKEVDIEIYEQIADELEEENIGKRVEIEELITKIKTAGPNISKSYEDEITKQKDNVATAKSDLMWAKEELKKVEKMIEKEKNKIKQEILDHDVTKEMKKRLLAKSNSKLTVKFLNADKDLRRAEADIKEIRVKRDETKPEISEPDSVLTEAEEEKTRIFEETKDAMEEDIKKAEERIKKLRILVGNQRDLRDDEATLTLTKYEKLGILHNDVEYYRPFYDEKFQRWVDQRLWEQPTIEQVIHPHVKLAAIDISKLWRENIAWLLDRHREEDQEMEKEKMAQQMKELNKQKDTQPEQEELNKDLKDALAEKRQLEENNNMLVDFVKFMEDEGKNDSVDDEEKLSLQDQERDQLLAQINECQLLIKELTIELPNAREEIEKFRSLLAGEDKRIGEEYRYKDEEDKIKELAKLAVQQAKPRDIPDGTTLAIKEKEDKADDTKAKAQPEKNPPKTGDDAQPQPNLKEGVKPVNGVDGDNAENKTSVPP